MDINIQRLEGFLEALPQRRRYAFDFRTLGVASYYFIEQPLMSVGTAGGTGGASTKPA